MITYLKGDATVPQAKGPKIIAHIVNTLGVWGAGFVIAVSRRWPEPEEAYRRWHRERSQKDSYGSRKEFSLGYNQVVQVKPDIWVVNMIAQQGIGTGSKGPPIRYDALALCLSDLDKIARTLKASIHLPRIGTGLAGGKWDRIEPLITKLLDEHAVYVYDWNPS